MTPPKAVSCLALHSISNNPEDKVVPKLLGTKLLLVCRQPTQNSEMRINIASMRATALLSPNETQLPVGRQTAPYSPAPGSDHVQIEPRLRDRTPSAWMILCTLGGSIMLHQWQHSIALGGSITLHRVAELIVFST
jgi:hypothetical protein